MAKDIEYQEMAIEALQKVAQELAVTRAKIIAEHKLVAALIEAKLAEKSAAEKLDAMSPAEQIALKQKLGTDD